MKCLVSMLCIGTTLLVGCGSTAPPADNTPGDLSTSSVLTQGLELPPGTNAILAVKSTVGKSSSNAKASSASAQVGDTVTIDSAAILVDEVRFYADESDEGNDPGDDPDGDVDADGNDEGDADGDDEADGADDDATGGDESGNAGDDDTLDPAADDGDAAGEDDPEVDDDTSDEGESADADGGDDAQDDADGGEEDGNGDGAGGEDDADANSDEDEGEGADSDETGHDEGDDDSDDDLVLEGPFFVDLVAETVLNLGTGNLDADTDDDGIDDVDDSDDDGDGRSDEDDSDDDNDGVPDDDDQTVGETSLFDALDLPPGTYSRVELLLAPLEAEDAPEPDHPMIGLSVQVAGSLNGTPFEFCGDFEETIVVEAPNGIVVEDGTLATFLLSFDPPAWFADIDPSVGTLNADGVLSMCNGENADLAQLVRDAISDHARLGEDADGDGDDDDDEDGDLEDDSEEDANDDEGDDDEGDEDEDDAQGADGDGANDDADDDPSADDPEDNPNE